MAEIYLQKDLIEKCKAGDSAAQYRLYNMYSKAMYNICLRMMKDRAEAEDVLQNSFVDVFSKLDQFSFQSTPGAWIKRIVVNNCINQLKKRRIQFEDMENVKDYSEEVFVPERSLNIDVVSRGIQALPEGYKTVLNLYLMEGYDHKEISQILDISESTSKTQYSRAKKKLKNIILSGNQAHNFLQA